ncbi:MAG: YraN family protein [Patescibacteria group bacterium]
MLSKKEIGQKGETLVQEYLIKKGYKILERNWRFGYLEVDIISKLDDKLVFFEVKTRTGDSLDGAENAIKSKQIQKIKRAMIAYSQINNISLEKIRLDFIAVTLDLFLNKKKIAHFNDILI